VPPGPRLSKPSLDLDPAVVLPRIYRCHVRRDLDADGTIAQLVNLISTIR